MKKYVSYVLTAFEVYPSHIEIDTTVAKKVCDLVGDGYEIISAVPLSGSNFAGIQYILRKEIKK